jgi:hypothetical protein
MIIELSQKRPSVVKNGWVNWGTSSARKFPTSMLGPPKERELDRCVLVSLDRLVPTNHFYRHLEATLDLSFVRERVTELYAAGDRPSIDPFVFFKFQLVMFFGGIRSERTLVKTTILNLAHRWYLGYHLDEPQPDRSSLIKTLCWLLLASYPEAHSVRNKRESCRQPPSMVSDVWTRPARPPSSVVSQSISFEGTRR